VTVPTKQKAPMEIIGLVLTLMYTIAALIAVLQAQSAVVVALWSLGGMLSLILVAIAGLPERLAQEFGQGNEPEPVPPTSSTPSAAEDSGPWRPGPCAGG
jgi:hypothetical protein